MVIFLGIGVVQVSDAQDDNATARVLIAGGAVQAESSGKIISLARRSEIFLGDKIITALDGLLQIRFAGNAILCVIL